MAENHKQTILLFGSTMIKLFRNPIFWIVIWFVACIFCYLFYNSQTYGTGDLLFTFMAGPLFTAGGLMSLPFVTLTYEYPSLDNFIRYFSFFLLAVLQLFLIFMLNRLKKDSTVWLMGILFLLWIIGNTLITASISSAFRGLS